MNSNGTEYATGDHLASPRVITNSSGSVVSRHDYKPFGEELGAGVGGRTTGMGFSNSGDNNRKQYTGYERDTETGLDFAQARYYANLQGRFTSPDPFSASATITDPQTFNRYTYCRNNPVNSVDPSGLSRGPAPILGSNNFAADVGAMLREHGEDYTAESYAQYEQNLANTYAAINEANFLNEAQRSGMMTADEATDIAANNPMLEAQPQTAAPDPGFFPDSATYGIGGLSFTGADLNIAARVVYAESSSGFRRYDGEYLGDKVNDERDGIASVLYNLLSTRLSTFNAVAHSGRFNTVTTAGETGKFEGSAPGSYQTLSEARVNSRGQVYGGDFNDLRSSVDAIRRMVNNGCPRYDFTRFRGDITPLTYNGNTATVLGHSRFGYAGYFPEGRR